MPAIKKEPGTEEPLHAIAQADPMPKSAKGKTRSDSPEGSHLSKKKRLEAGEVWQYLKYVSSGSLVLPSALSGQPIIHKLLELPRKRGLPVAWKTRLVSEKPSLKVLTVIINYLVGDDPGSVICGLRGSRCTEEWRTVGPAIVSLEEGNQTIYKAAAFPNCILFPVLGSSQNPSSKRTCCNAYYRNSKSPSMPDIWSPPNPIPAPASSSSPYSSSIKKKPATEESPFTSRGRSTETKSCKRKKRSDSPSESSPRKKQKQQILKPDDNPDEEKIEKLQRRVKATETWQYIGRFTPFELTVPEISKGLVKLLEHPRKRDLPMAWKRRLALEKPSHKITRLLLNFLTGDEESNYLCSLPGANCRVKWETVGPAIDSMQEGNLTIYKDGAFPRCVLFETRSGKKKCCNAVYRDAKSDLMPAIWSPPDAAPDPTPASTPSPVSSPIVAKALPANINPETPMHQRHHEAQAQQETGLTTSLWEQRNEALYLSGPGNASTSYAHSAGWLQQRQGQVLPTGTDGSTLQILDLQNTGTTTPLASDFQNLSCIVFEGTVEVILQDVPVFTISRGGHWAVGVGKECRVRNLGAGTKAILYIVGISA